MFLTCQPLANHVYFEIQADDAERAIDFYSQLFEWKFTATEGLMKHLAQCTFAVICCIAVSGCVQRTPTAPTIKNQPQAEAVPVLAWENGEPKRQKWSQELREQVRQHLSSFDEAQDIQEYCPRYSNLPDQERVEVIAAIAVGIARYESEYRPHAYMKEPAPLYYGSVGLFQLAYQDKFSWCSLNRKSKSLENPVNNIRCAIPQMAKLVEQDQVIAAGSNNHNAKGLARYWKVIRSGPKNHRSDIRSFPRALPFCGSAKE